MNILFLTDNFPPETNAIASRVFERARYWVRWGHTVTIITSVPNFPEGKVYSGYKNRWHQIELIEGIKVVRVKTFIAKNQGFFFRTLDFISYSVPAIFASLFQKNQDIVVATSPQFFVACTGWIVAILKRRNFILEIADLWPASIVGVGMLRAGFLLTLLEKLELFLYKQADALIVLTSSYKKNMVERGIEESKIHVILNGVELDRYKPTTKDRQLAQELHIENSFVIGYIGTLGMAQGLENVLDTAELLRKNARVRFLFVGSGAARDSLLAEKEKRNLSNVIFVGAQPKESVQRYWSLCDVVLVHLKDMPIFKTVIPSKLFEAMGMGLPILLVAPEGEASQLVCEEGTGIWIKPNDPKLFYETLQLLQQDSLRKKMREQSISYAPMHTREKQAHEMSEVFKKYSKT